MAEAAAAFKTIPEIFEVELGESLTARTESLSTFRELGPPDLVHVVKSTGRSGQRDIGTYHYVSGVDASTSASVAAYINSLTYNMEDDAGWFTKGSGWKLRSGCYCCFNAFSRVDVRVDVKIPGGVNPYVVDLRGERHEATPEIWLETYLSGMLRSILYSDDPNYWLDAYRKLDPVRAPDEEMKFLRAAEALFSKGWQVGSDPEIQVATVVSNHLTNAIMKYFGDSGRYQHAANLFEKIIVKEPEVSSLLAKSYIGMHQEVRAVQIMAAATKQNPQSYTLLHVQSDFLRAKGNFEWALKLARQAVNCAPSEFVTWEKLTDCYIDLGQYENALLTLNSCPMFTYNGRDAHRTLTASRIHLPPNGTICDILPDRAKTEDDEADPALLRLPAPGLRGTWARAYALLARLVSKIGWDELLKTRSAVFVMEEEYRAQKAQVEAVVSPRGTNGKDVPASDRVIHEDGSVTTGDSTKVGSEEAGEFMADDNASTMGVRSTAGTPAPPADADPDANVDAIANGLPTIRISTESNRERVKEAEANGDGDAEEQEKEEAPDAAKPKLEKPTTAELADGESTPNPSQEAFSFSNKRLCERWLDNLFMVLYEDLRVWTIFRAEVAHFKTQHVAYRKTGLEWEILGDLGARLHHKEEAKEAYQRCLDATRYSHKPWSKLLDMYTEEGDIQRTLQVAVRCAAYLTADYGELAYPTQMARCLYKLGEIHGHQKLSYSLLSMNLPADVQKIMEEYLMYARVFKVEGWDF